jgi:hypothetical protein
MVVMGMGLTDTRTGYTILGATHSIVAEIYCFPDVFLRFPPPEVFKSC